jgi:alkylation response protein AidB-like acyl-CoA dehydrogenase
MPSFFADNDDLRFYFDRGLDWASLIALAENGFRAPDGPGDVADALAAYREAAELIGQLAAEEIAPLSTRLDREPPRIQDGEAVVGAAAAAVAAHMTRLGLHGLPVPRELGGMNAPLALYFVGFELLARGDISAMMQYSFHAGIAMSLLVWSLQEGSTNVDPATGRLGGTRFADAIAEIVRGDAWGCMDITEPNAGSDMAALRTVGEQAPDGSWTVTGQKIFISSGHGKYHCVVARTEKPTASDDPLAGLNGLSMFLVKAYEDRPDGTRVRYVTLDRLEDKLGQHGSVTAAISFDHAPGELIGKRGEGFKYMLLLMNNARIAVGFAAIGVSEAAHRMAQRYAEERRSMGKPIARHELIADKLDEMRTDIQALRALAFHAVYHEEMTQKLTILERFAASPSAAEARLLARLPEHRAKARRATPLLKYLAGERAVEIARGCVQIHGGIGYTRDLAAEKLLRDAVLLPIYEGTSQIQALMATKDTLVGMIKRPQQFLTRLAQARWRAVSARDELERRVARVQLLALAAQQHLATRTAASKLRTLAGVPMASWARELTRSWDPRRDFALALLHAERLTRVRGDELIAEILLEQARRFPERRELLERFLDRAEPRCRALHDEITTTGARLLASLDGGGELPAGTRAAG